MLASGSGTNLQALIDDPLVGTHICCVVSDNRAAGALERADRAGIPGAVVSWADYDNRASFSAACAEAAEAHGAKAVVLAGFMRVLSSSFLERFPDRVVNIHPSLLPAFPGGNAVEDALDHGAKVTGVTVHFVDEKVDHGPIIAQEAIEVVLGDTVSSLHGRIQEVEHRLYPEVVRALIEQRLSIVGRKVVWG